MLVKLDSTLSPQGHEIVFFGIEKDKELPNIFILGGFHGDEPEGEFIIHEFIEELKVQNHEDLNYNLYFLPCLNPDGREAKTRVNSNKVDLNRNYPTKNFEETGVSPSGTHLAGTPGSESETQFMMKLVNQYNPVRILSIHSDLHLVDYDGPARDLALKISEASGYKFVENVGYPTSGSFGTWAGIEKQIPLITLETWGAKTPADFIKIWEEVRPAMYKFIE